MESKSSKFFLFAGILTVLALLLIYTNKTKSPEENGQVAEAQPIEQQEAAPKTLETPAEPIATAQPIVQAAPQEEKDPDVVTFEVKDGLAIAFGDIIVGQPEEEGVKEGLYKLPVPEYWDKPEIPFAIDANLPKPERVQEALKHITNKTGVKFVPYSHQKDAIVFQEGKEHCLSALGRKGGLQPIKISSLCTWNEIVHETLHSMGFIHEQSRSDRDQFVEVLWDNIETNYKPQFDILPDAFLGPSKNSPFDYNSIMLYSPEMFAKNKGDKTLQSRTPSAISPSRTGLSLQDTVRIKRLFSLD